MIYFFSSSRKSDKLSHPLTICSSNQHRAVALAIVNFKKNNLKGTPKLIEL